MNDLVDPSRRDTDVLRQPILTDLHGIEELLEQDFAGMHRR
jgi:hypothetical protein